MSYVNASGLTTSDMGSMGGNGGFGGGMGRNKENFGNRGQSDGTTAARPNTNTFPNRNMQDASASTEEDTVEPGKAPESAENFDSSQMPNSFGGQMPNMGEVPDGFSDMFSGQSEKVPSDFSGNAGSAESGNRPSRDNMQFGGSWETGVGSIGASVANRPGWLWLAVSALILCAGLLIAKLYKY